MIAYDPELSLRLAEAAVASYSEGDELAGWSERRGYVCKAWSEGAAQAAVFCRSGVPDGEVVVAMRGTDDGLDWRVDSRFFKVRRSWFIPMAAEEDAYLEARLHRGFVAYAERLASLIEAEVRRYPTRPIHVCGHSLGGALSYLVAVHLVREGFDVATVHAFSSPRVGNRPWAESYDSSPLGSRTFRVVGVNRGELDLVTRMPPPFLGYWHAGRPIIVTGSDRYDTEAAWDAVRSGAWRWRVLTRTLRAVQAHPTGALIRALRADAERARSAAKVAAGVPINPELAVYQRGRRG